MRKKRFLAVVLAASMAMASAVTAAAAPTVATGSETMGSTGTTVTGTGQTEGFVDMDVFNVVVPTTVSRDSIFDYILDPQELISATDAARYVSGNTVNGVPVSINSGNFTPSSLYFVNDITVSGATRLSNTSDPYKLINKSTMDVDVSVNAVLNGGTGITVSTDETFNGGKSTDTSMYMALKAGNTKKTISGGNPSGYLLTATMANAKDKYEKTLLSDNNTYQYAIPSQNAATGQPISDNDFAGRYEFQLTGSCNTAADWSVFAKAGASAPSAPTVQVTYYLNPHVDRSAAPSIATTTYTVQQGRAVEVDVNLGAGNLAATGITEITYTNSSGAVTTLTTDKYSFANDKLTFTADYIDNLYNSLTAAGRVYKVKFNDTATTTIDVTLRR